METQILRYLAPKLNHLLRALDLHSIEEVRVRLHAPLILRGCKKERGVNARGYCLVSESYHPTQEDLLESLQLMTNHSWYALEDQIALGYLTLPGGHRVGLAGSLTLEQQRVKTIKYPQALNIRIARAVCSGAKEVLPFIRKPKGICTTLLLSPPGCGKTTLLRDLARVLSNQGFQVTIIDERSEIAGCFHGVPQMDVGCRTDVLDGCPKSLGVQIALRGLSPEILITDEIGAPSDGEVLADLCRGGVTVIASCHGDSLESVKRRLGTSTWDVFERVVILSNRKGPGTIEQVLKTF